MFITVKNNKVLSSSVLPPNKEVCDKAGYVVLEIPDNKYKDEMLTGVVVWSDERNHEIHLPPTPFHYYDAFGRLQTVAPILDIKDILKQEVDTLVEQIVVRKVSVSNATIQDLREQKYQQAVEFRSVGYSDKQLTNFPFIVMEATVTSQTAKVCADIIINKKTQENSFLVMIEEIRRTINEERKRINDYIALHQHHTEAIKKLNEILNGETE